MTSESTVTSVATPISAQEIATQVLSQLDTLVSPQLTTSDFAPEFMATLRSMVEASLDTKLAPLLASVPNPTVDLSTGTALWTCNGLIANVVDTNVAWAKGVWVSPYKDTLGLPGQYTYSVAFTSKEETLNLQVAADNNLSHVILDGVKVSIPDNISFATMVSLSIPIIAGKHVISFVVTNGGTDLNPTALLVETV